MNCSEDRRWSSAAKVLIAIRKCLNVARGLESLRRRMGGEAFSVATLTRVLLDRDGGLATVPRPSGPPDPRPLARRVPQSTRLLTGLSDSSKLVSPFAAGELRCQSVPRNLEVLYLKLMVVDPSPG
jgi:hypothetical protein